jgi:hypothetical protein
MFRKLVAERVNEYKTLQNKGDRPGMLRLVRTVIDQVKNHGGRFLDKNWKNEVRKKNTQCTKYAMRWLALFILN